MNEAVCGSDGQVRRQVWSEWLDGESVSSIQRYLDLSRREIQRILDDGPPEDIKRDHRYVNGCRTFWISAALPEQSPASGERDAFIVVRSPRSYTVSVFRKALRAIRHDFLSVWPSGTLNFAALEAIEGDVADKFVGRGYMAWSFDTEGAVTRFGPAWSMIAPELPAPGR